MPAPKLTHLQHFEAENGTAATTALRSLADQQATTGDNRRAEEIVEVLAEILNTMGDSKDPAEMKLYDETRAALRAPRGSHSSATHQNLLELLSLHEQPPSAKSYAGMTQFEIFAEGAPKMADSLKNLAAQKAADGDERSPDVIAEDLARILNTLGKSQKPDEQQLYRETETALFATKNADMSLFIHTETPHLDATYPDTKKALLRLGETLDSRNPLPSAESFAAILSNPNHAHHSATKELLNGELRLITEEAKAAGGSPDIARLCT